ncbi:MAG TPA: hypothetical protein VKY19_18750 [Ktedonosporobacter sp.]|nr:hypothetical protein [Ktedonosporobacter sp.]
MPKTGQNGGASCSARRYTSTVQRNPPVCDLRLGALIVEPDVTRSFEGQRAGNEG